jgi:excisionase family DNA binding protein
MNDEMLTDGLVRVPEAARFLGLSRSTIYGLMDTGALRYVKIGKSRRIIRADLSRLIEQHTVPAPGCQALADN